jgi:hypothetical protein
LVALAFKPILNGKPLLVGEPSAVLGGEVTPTNARFYVSEVELLRADGSPVAVDLVTATGSAAPYGVQLVNLEEPEASTVRLLAPTGTYAGARFTFGINDACNSGGVSQGPPLSANSQMVWPHVAGFLFFRYEALWTAVDTTALAPPSMIHMGGVVGNIFAPRAEVQGALTVPPPGGSAPSIRVSFDEIFRGASGTEPVSGLLFATPEVVAGDQLRQAVPRLPIFTFETP